MNCFRVCSSLIAVFIFVLHPGRVWAQNNIIGRWQETDFFGITVLSDQCIYASVMTRALWLEETPSATTVGVYSTYEQLFWVVRNDSKCALPGKQPGSPIFQRVRYFLANVISSKNGVSQLHGEFRRCEGDYCDDPNMFRLSFTTTIKVQGDNLIDGAQDLGGTSQIVYRRENVALDVALEGEAAVEELMG